MPVSGVRLEGLTELNRALGKVDKGLQKTVRNELKAAGEPVRAAAEGLAVANISRVGPVWSRMRVGATSREVYIAPKQRRRGGSPRPRFGRMLLELAMRPAAERHRQEIVLRLGRALDRLISSAGF